MDSEQKLAVCLESEWYQVALISSNWKIWGTEKYCLQVQVIVKIGLGSIKITQHPLDSSSMPNESQISLKKSTCKTIWYFKASTLLCPTGTNRILSRTLNSEQIPSSTNQFQVDSEWYQLVSSGIQVKFQKIRSLLGKE